MYPLSDDFAPLTLGTCFDIKSWDLLLAAELILVW
jgi:hypothetical protein